MSLRDEPKVAVLLGAGTMKLQVAFTECHCKATEHHSIPWLRSSCIYVVFRMLFSVVELTFDNLRTFFSERKTSTPQNSSAASTPQRMSTDFLDTMQGTNVDMGSIDNGPETPTPSDELVPSLHEALNTDILTDVEAILSPNRIDNNFLTWL